MTRARVLVVAVATLALATYAFPLLGDPFERVDRGTFADVGGVALTGAFAAACALDAARRAARRLRLAWSLLTLGLACSTIGSLLRAFHDLAGATPPTGPAITDVFFFALPVCGAAAGVLLPFHRDDQYPIRLLLDGVIVASSTFVVLWVLLLRAPVTHRFDTGLPYLVAIAYPFTDLVLVTMSVLVAAKARGGHRTSPVLLAAGFGCLCVANGLNPVVSASAWTATHLVILGWAVGIFLMGLAALTAHPELVLGPRTPTGPSRLSLWLPYLPVTIALPVGTYGLWYEQGGDVALPVVVTVLCGAALVRQFLLLEENRRLLGRMAAIGLRDPQTGLPNRALFYDRVEHALALRAPTTRPVNVLTAEIDGFSLVRDGLGHTVGEEVLCQTARRITSRARAHDTVARLDGEVFAILVEDDPDVAFRLAEDMSASFGEPVEVTGHVLSVRPSFGMSTAGQAVGITADELVGQAERAMLAARGSRSGVARSAAGDTSTPRDGGAGIRLLGELRQSVRDGELALLYQPKVELCSGAMIGLEALLRWPNPRLGMLGPADFLPLVREHGLMEAVTEIVVNRAITDAVDWHAAGVRLPVAINLAAPSLQNEDFPRHVQRILDDHGLSPHWLGVEITEDLLLSNLARARSVLQQLRESGVRVAIDDFGSGYATMTYLRELPIDELKVDRQFVAPILNDARAAAIVRSVVELAATFGIACVAEGVEDAETARRLRDIGCRFAQGHLFHRPLPAEEVVRLAAAGPTRPSWV